VYILKSQLTEYQINWTQLLPQPKNVTAVPYDMHARSRLSDPSYSVFRKKVYGSENSPLLKGTSWQLEL